MAAFELGSATAKGGFANEKVVCRKFNAKGVWIGNGIEIFMHGRRKKVRQGLHCKIQLLLQP